MGRTASESSERTLDARAPARRQPRMGRPGATGAARHRGLGCRPRRFQRRARAVRDRAVANRGAGRRACALAERVQRTTGRRDFGAMVCAAGNGLRVRRRRPALHAGREPWRRRRRGLRYRRLADRSAGREHCKGQHRPVRQTRWHRTAMPALRGHRPVHAPAQRAFRRRRSPHRPARWRAADNAAAGARGQQPVAAPVAQRDGARPLCRRTRHGRAARAIASSRGWRPCRQPRRTAARPRRRRSIRRMSSGPCHGAFAWTWTRGAAATATSAGDPATRSSAATARATTGSTTRAAGTIRCRPITRSTTNGCPCIRSPAGWAIGTGWPGYSARPASARSSVERGWSSTSSRRGCAANPARCGCGRSASIWTT